MNQPDAADLATTTVVLTEDDSRALLADAGIPCNRHVFVTTADEALAQVGAVGFPAVLKIVSPDIVHKSDVGGVVTDIRDPEQLRSAWTRLHDAVHRSAPDAHVVGCSLQAMVSGDIELYVGLKRDPIFGVAVLFGLGGIWVEILRDTAVRVSPFDRAEVARMIDDIRSAPLLHGIRGRPPVDLEALETLIQRVADLGHARPDLLELDLNPIMAQSGGVGVTAVDARVVLRVHADKEVSTVQEPAP